VDAGLFEGLDPKRIKSDPRKFSTAISFENDEDGYAANLIYSDDSFLPKIAYGNSSIKMFGSEYAGIEVI
jgi:hypothetical protein